MKPYELTVLLHPDLEIDPATPIGKLEKIIGGAGGSIAKRDNWGKRRLSYNIKKQSFAVYVYFDLMLPPEAPMKIERGLLITDEVLRFLLVKQDRPSAGIKPTIDTKTATDKEK